jgi:alpha-ribazole phosphatase
MSAVYLIRHTTPAVAKGICYGQTDLDITESFFEEAELIRQQLPDDMQVIHSSPLQRCARLAALLFPAQPVTLHNELMEIHCGQWEMRGWDDLPKEEIDPWMKDFVHVRIPDGESYEDLYERVIRCFNEIRSGVPGSAGGPGAIVAHGGVLRSILSYITGTPLIDSFKLFPLYYGCVIRINEEGASTPYEILLNRMPEEKEQHKPSVFQKK